MSRHYEKPEIVGFLDVGTANVTCAIVERSFPVGLTAPPILRVLGVGHQRAEGVKAGVVVHMDQAEAAVRAAVGQAERMADVVLEDVIATVSCGRQTSSHFTAHVDLASGAVSPQDLDRLAKGAGQFAARDGRTIVHMNRVSYALDGELGIRNPLRLAGRRLSATWHAVAADEQPLRNHRTLIDRAYLRIRQFVASSFATSLAATTSEERQLGTICVDMGAGTIDIAAFSDGQFLYTDTIPVGGSHLTYDIARILSTSLAEAERIKVLYGTLVRARSDEHNQIQYALAGELEGEAYPTTKAELHRIVYPRVESQLGLLSERIEQCYQFVQPDASIVLTGGASQIVGLADLAARKLQRPVRISSSANVAGLPASMQSAAFSTVVGAAQVPPSVSSSSYQSMPSRKAGGRYLDRMEQWLRASF